MDVQRHHCAGFEIKSADLHDVDVGKLHRLLKKTFVQMVFRHIEPPVAFCFYYTNKQKIVNKIADIQDESKQMLNFIKKRAI